MNYNFYTEAKFSIIETRSDLAKVLDPFYGDNRIVDLFINSVNDKIKEESPFPLDEITTDEITTASDIQIIYKFKKPSKYPLLTLLIKE